MNLLQEAEQFLREFSPEIKGPDASGIRGKGLERPNRNRDKDFPYDHETFYGEPQSYDRGSNHTGGLHKSITPKDDEHFSLSLLDVEELVREVLGSPILFGRSNNSNLPSSVPGSSGGWAHPPKKPWDDEEMIPGDVDEDMDPEMSDDMFGDEPAMPLPTRVMIPRVSDSHESGVTVVGMFGILPQRSAWDAVSKMAWKHEE